MNFATSIYTKVKKRHIIYECGYRYFACLRRYVGENLADHLGIDLHITSKLTITTASQGSL